MRKVMVVTRAEQMRRQMFKDYSAKAGRASRSSPKAHCLTYEDRRRGAIRRRLNALIRKDLT